MWVPVPTHPTTGAFMVNQSANRTLKKRIPERKTGNVYKDWSKKGKWRATLKHGGKVYRGLYRKLKKDAENDFDALRNKLSLIHI